MESFELSVKYQFSGQSFRNQNYCYKVKAADVANDPFWNPAKELPPLSIEDAIKRAYQELQQYTQTDEDWDFSRITFIQIEEFRWIYQIAFSTKVQVEKLTQPNQFIILIKMDGIGIKPIFEDKIFCLS